MNYKEQAFKEYNSEEFMVRPGGKNGRGFWNVNSTQFIFCPCFSFPIIPKANGYLFTLTDEKGNVHTFTAENPTASLAPVWKDIPTGMVALKVESLDKTGQPQYLTGARTFFKADGFPGRDALPERACSYKECAAKAFAYVYNEDFNQHWLRYGTPDPMYPHNVYPSKTISSIMHAMISYAQLAPENRENALQLAKNAADYLISISYGENSPIPGLPPTYSFAGLDFDTVDQTAPMAKNRTDKIMMIYPASAGLAYLALSNATGDEKYDTAAMRIADYYREHVLSCGSWYLMLSTETGEPESDNVCASYEILDFLHAVYKRTGDEIWHTLEKNYFSNLQDKRFTCYNWEGQFEDILLSGSYMNLTHMDADSLINYIVENLSDDPKAVEDAKELMRFVEDQFVVWGKFSPLGTRYDPEKDFWYSPAGLEQYYWYVPIDASTTRIMKAFLDVYAMAKEPLLLEKACALGDMVTRMQNKETGVIPTHWMKKDCIENLENYWINCQIGSATCMMHLAKVVGEL
jgi:hypothetical protein